jgi:hypothetical protein
MRRSSWRLRRWRNLLLCACCAVCLVGVNASCANTRQRAAIRYHKTVVKLTEIFMPEWIETEAPDEEVLEGD